MSAIAILFALGLGAATPVSAAPAQPEERRPLSAGCRQALERDWGKLSSERDDARAVALVEGLETACAGDREALAMLAGFHAEIDFRAGRYAEAAARIERAPLHDTDPIWSTTRWTWMASLEMTGDAAAYRRVRDAFVAVHDRELQAHPRHRMRKVERFETPAAFVDAYEGLAQQGSFRRLAVFVAAPKNGGMPVTLTLTRSMGVEALMGESGQAAYFLDLYPCGGHATLEPLGGTPERPPSYAVARAKAMEVFSSAQTFPAFARREEARFCAFESYMMPGFDPAEQNDD